jgi:hypothetical protein
MPDGFIPLPPRLTLLAMIKRASGNDYSAAEMDQTEAHAFGRHGESQSLEGLY